MEPNFLNQCYAITCYVLGTAFAISTSIFFVKLYLVRSKTLSLQRQGLAMPPLHPVFGHLIFCYSIMSKLPKDAHPHYLPDQIRRELPELGPIFYLDAWPFLTLTLVVASPSTMYQITQGHTLPKFPAIRSFLHPLTNGIDIVSMDGQEWKMWRSVFNPAFSASHLMTLVPDMIKETRVFCRMLREHARKQDVFTMKALTDDLAIDIIGRAVLDTNLDSQQHKNPMVEALRRQMRWLTFGSEGLPLQRCNPVRPLVHAYNTYQMDKYLLPKLHERLASHQEEDTVKATKHSRSGIDLCLTAYASGKAGRTAGQGVDATFQKAMMSQIKLFLFSGHDTTSSSICYIFYLLSIHPASLEQVRAEHEQVFGSDPEKAASLLAENPYLLNKLPYTTAVIKETTRLFPAASTTRSGVPGFYITDTNGRQYPTEGCLLYLISQAVQRDPAFWPQPDTFLPERWLAPLGDALYPVKGAWRPFEHGPRSCIGLELAMTEMRLVMVLALRHFDISVCYEELDRDSSSIGMRTVDGERAYQVQLGQPSGNLPCRVKEAARRADV